MITLTVLDLVLVVAGSALVGVGVGAAVWRSMLRASETDCQALAAWGQGLAEELRRADVDAEAFAERFAKAVNAWDFSDPHVWIIEDPTVAKIFADRAEQVRRDG